MTEPTYAAKINAAVVALQRWFRTLDGVCKALDVHPMEVRARLDDDTARRLQIRESGCYAPPRPDVAPDLPRARKEAA